MFLDSSDGIEEYTTSATSFINQCIDNILPTVTGYVICTYISQPKARD
jgi:hypothetical protein